MKNQLISVGLLSLVLAGCNMTDFRLPTIGESNSDSAATKTASASQSDIVSNSLIDEMCTTAKKNKARAQELYMGKVISARGRFLLGELSNNRYSPGIDFETQNYNVIMDMNSKTEPWKQYDRGQIVNSGSIKITQVVVRLDSILFDDKCTCYIIGNDL
ncbi:MAG: hypothetical protein J6I35_02610 [Ruminobacter sp.]|jgi:hypothetical protein|uniref:hypothetical protein n=1 Tax=unclassified Ruminobacter TaxID=2627913 RepID=UPI0004E21672|nr:MULTISPECIES: hypothetical protein [unclassified Ruminobacter]MBP3748436.1 hypothetical protein [Ruminobacter sp.]